MSDLHLILILAIMAILCYGLGFFTFAILVIGGRAERIEVNTALLGACESAYNYLNGSPMLTDDEESLLLTLETTIEEARSMK